ncbi:MAG TPA: DciA family protein [Steroidobacteraceae bacterium]
MTSRFKSLGDGLGPLITNLERRAREVQELGDRVRAVLPAPEREHFLGATYRGETLVISMDSAAWCSRLRYDQEALIRALHEAGETRVAKIKVRVGKKT